MVSYISYLKKQIRYRADLAPYTGKIHFMPIGIICMSAVRVNKILHTDPKYKDFVRGSFKEKYGDDCDTQHYWKEYQKHQYHE